MSQRTKLILRLLAVIVAAGGFYISLADSSFGASVFSESLATRSAQQPQNPCNPCSKKKQAQNPCNPCAKKMSATGKVYQDAASYRSWTKLTEPKVSVGHGGKHVVTYANSTADAAVKSHKFPFKNGAKFIKEGYDDAGGRAGELTALYVMEKRGKNWYYAMTDVKGNIQMEGVGKQAQMCASCHAGAKKTDSVFAAGDSPGTMPMNPCNPCAKKKKG